MSKLLIVEAPGKVKKLQGYCPPGFRVMASAGHVRDLPAREMGVAPPDFRASYVVTKDDVVKRLKAAAESASEVILATDLDREGEAIAWHLAEVLRLKSPKRIVYSEISERALRQALAAPRSIDLDLVRAQESRRVIDRLVGFRVSGELCRLTGMKLSAGRVQTPALMILVMREREIRGFVATKHYGVRAHFATDNGKLWHADWNFRPLIEDKDRKHWLDKEFAAKVATLKDFRVEAVEQKESRRRPSAPFTTSTLQQAASSQLGLRPKQTMELAQRLYEAGLITYHRTDSPNMSREAAEAVWAVLQSMGCPEYAAEGMNVWKAKGNAQEAHECIRPTNFADRAPGTADEQSGRLYDLIWRRAMASQMKPAVLDVTTVTLAAARTLPGRGEPEIFIARGSVERFPGWRAVYQEHSAEGEDGDEQSLPRLSEGDRLAASETELQEKKTQPPPRYTEASLVKKLEEEGIGRPSTYAAIIETLHARGYAHDEKKKLVPTEVAFKVVDALAGRFEFADLPYTRQVESDLDLIVHGSKTYLEVVASVNTQLDRELGQLTNAGLEAASSPTCPAEGCEGRLRRINGKKGPFWSCSRYPDCRETRPDAGGKPGDRGQAQGDPKYPCPDCGKPMALREGKTGKFWSCTGYPGCLTSLPNERGKPVHHKCPDCGKPLRKLKAKQGKNAGKAFWGCAGFAEGCRFAAPDANGKPQIGEKA